MTVSWKSHGAFLNDEALARPDLEFEKRMSLSAQVSEEFICVNGSDPLVSPLDFFRFNGIRLFGSREDAIEFAQDEGISVDVTDPQAPIYVPTLEDILSGEMPRMAFGTILDGVNEYRFGGDIDAMVSGADQNANMIANYISGAAMPVTMVEAAAIARDFDLDTFGVILAWISDWKNGFADFKRSNHGGQVGAFKVKVLIQVAAMLKNGVFPRLDQSLGFTEAMDWAEFILDAGLDEKLVLESLSVFIGNFPAVLDNIHDKNGEFMATFGKTPEWNAMAMRIASRHFQKSGDYDKAYLAALNGGKALEDMDGLDGVGRIGRTGEKLRLFDESIAMAREVPELIEGLRSNDFLQYVEDIREAIDELKQESWLTPRLEMLERGGNGDGFSIAGVEKVLEEVRAKGMAEEDMLALARFFLQNGLNLSAFSHLSFRHLWGAAKGAGTASAFEGSIAEELERLDALIDGREIDVKEPIQAVFPADGKITGERAAAEALINSAALRMEIEVPTNENAIKPHDAVSYAYFSILAGFDATRVQGVMGRYLARRFKMTFEQALRGGIIFIRQRRPDIAAIHMGIASRYFEEKGEYVEATKMSLAAAGLLEDMGAELVHVREITQEMRRGFFAEVRRLAKRIKGKQFKPIKESLLNDVELGRQILKKERIHDGAQGIDMTSGEVSWFSYGSSITAFGRIPKVDFRHGKSAGNSGGAPDVMNIEDSAASLGKGARKDIASTYAELQSIDFADDGSTVEFGGIVYGGMEEGWQDGMTIEEGTETFAGEASIVEMFDAEISNSGALAIAGANLLSVASGR